MSNAVSPSDQGASAPQADLPAYVRARGMARLTATCDAGKTRPGVLRQEGALRLRLPNSHSHFLEATLINIAGGMTGGDIFSVECVAENDANLVISTTAAEKIYRVIEAPAVVATMLTARSGANLCWLPQETILFNQAHLHRTLTLDMAGDARVTMAEMTVFGRAGMGEQISIGGLRDNWRIRRDGRLVLAESTRLEGPVADLLAKPAIGNGAAAIATLIHLSPEAEDLCEPLRNHLIEHKADDCETGVSAFDGLMVARFIGQTGMAVRDTLTKALGFFDSLPLPRVWHS